jgi:hypothetical protein
MFKKALTEVASTPKFFALLGVLVGYSTYSDLMERDWKRKWKNRFVEKARSKLGHEAQVSNTLRPAAVPWINLETVDWTPKKTPGASLSREVEARWNAPSEV